MAVACWHSSAPAATAAEDRGRFLPRRMADVVNACSDASVRIRFRLNQRCDHPRVRDLVIEDQHTGYARRSDYAGRQPIHVNARGNARFCRKSMIRIHDQRRQQQPHCFRDNARVATTRHSFYLLAVLAGTVNATCRVST